MRYGFTEEATKYFPKMVHVNMSYICNAKCIHCVHTLYPQSRQVVGEDIYISDSVFKRLADECGVHGTYLRITGHGEPFLHPHFLGLMKYAKEKSCKVSIITNGSLLEKEMADALLDYGIDGLEFSVDAVTKETYEKIRRGLSFERLLTNLTYIKKTRDDRSAKTNLIVSFVEEKENRHERGLAVEFWVPKYADKVQFRVWLQYAKLSSQEDRRNLMKERQPCPYPFERIIIDSRGDFHLCAFDVDHSTNYGNIMNRTLTDVWQCREIDSLRQLLLRKEFNKIPICSRCTDWGCRSWSHNFWKLSDDAFKECMKIKKAEAT